jgi:metallophosphoesterase (TIGR00282 family)
MKLLLLGDVVGRSGRDAVVTQLPQLRREHGIHLAMVNGDNASHGFGIKPKHCEEFFRAGADVITAGDHVWDQPDIRGYLGQEKRVLRPHNFPASAPGTGIRIVELAGGAKVLVVHLLGQVFIRDHVDCPFQAIDTLLTQWKLGRDVQAIIVDFHAEATSEKTAMGMFLDGRVSAVVGTHTHIPTSDARVLPKGTAYRTDLGMCGVYDSVIGFDPEAPLLSFRTKIRKMGPRMTPATGNAQLGGLIVTVNEQTGLATKAEAISPVFG